MKYSNPKKLLVVLLRLQVPPVVGLTFFFRWFNKFKLNLPCGTFMFMATNSPHKSASLADFGYCDSVVLVIKLSLYRLDRIDEWLINVDIFLYIFAKQKRRTIL